MKKSIFRQLIAFALSLALIACLALPVFAVDNGGVTPAQAQQTDDEIVAEILADPNVSAAAKAQVQQKVAFVASYRNDPAATKQAYERASTVTQRATISSVSEAFREEPSRLRPPATYALNVTPIMQETKSLCSAATIQQTLRYIRGTSYTLPSQTTIIRATGAGPGLNTVLNYLNTKQSDNNYFRTNCANRAEFDDRLAYCATNFTPMIFTLKATTTTYWPYKTDGHFTNCDGNFSPSTYLFSDPYYFNYYHPNLPIPEPGYLVSTYDELSRVNKALMGTSYMQVGF